MGNNKEPARRKEPGCSWVIGLLSRSKRFQLGFQVSQSTQDRDRPLGVVGQDRIGQDKIGQNRIGQDRIGQNRDTIGQNRIGQGQNRVVKDRISEQERIAQERRGQDIIGQDRIEQHRTHSWNRKKIMGVKGTKRDIFILLQSLVLLLPVFLLLLSYLSSVIELNFLILLQRQNFHKNFYIFLYCLISFF